MKKASLLLAIGFCILMFDVAARGQSAGDFRSAASGNWNAIATWETFNGATWVAAVATPTSADGAISIRSPHVVTISASGLSYDQVVVDTGAQVTVAATITHTLANGAGTDLIINGTWLNSGGTWTISASATWMASAGGTYVHNTTSGIATPLGASTLDAASNFIYRGSSTLTPAVSTSGRTYGNLSFESTSGSYSETPNGAGTLTINGDFTIGSGVTLTISQTGVLTFAGSFTNNGTLTNSTGTQVYTFTGSGKSISGASAIQFETWNVNASASLTLMRDVSIASTFTGTISGTLNCGTNMVSGAGAFTLASGATLGIGSTTGVNGNITASGTQTFDPAANYLYNGSAAQVTGANLPATVGSLTSNNTSTGVTLSQSVTVTNALSITSSTFDQGASFNLTAGSVSVSSGATWKNLGTGAVTLAGNVTNNGTVNLNGGGVACGDADSILIRSSASPTQRTWSGMGVFDFTDVDVQDQTSAVALIAVSSTDSGNNTGWTFRSSCGPSAARLSSFAAKRYEDGTVLLEWQTGFEVDNLGYNIYRDEGGKRARLTPQLIAGSALLAGPGVSLMSGRSYAWTDSLAGDKQAGYWLEEVDLNGVSAWHGPFAVVRARQGDQLPPGGRTRAVLLSSLAAEGARQLQTTPVARVAQPVVTTAAGLATQSDLARASALKLAVSREGWYRVSAQELITAGLDAGIDPRNLRLYADGQEQAFIVKGEEDGKFDPQDAIEFYGVGLDTAATDTRVYWLTAGLEPGRRIQQVKGKGSRLAPASSTYTVERKDRTIYFSGLRNGDKENFFGAVIARNPVDQMISVEHLDTAAPGDAAIEVALQGVTALPHRVKVELNGTVAGEVSFTGQTEGVATLRLPQAALREGQNTVRLTPLGAESDVSLVDYIRIAYSHTNTADSNALRFTLSSKQQAVIGGFSSPSIRVLDITDPNEIRQASAQVQQQGEGYSVTVSAPKPGGRTLWALADDQARQVAAITSNRPSNLRDVENAADFVIVAHRDFLESVKPLQSLRESQGLKVVVVDVEDVYDEFNYGDKSPQAIKDFLAFAGKHWRTPPRFALFVGDASLDPKNYMGRGDYDFVPSRLIDTALMETVSDEWLADFDGDGLAEMALGRLPVRTASEASRIIDKIVSYDRAPRTQNILLVSDLNDGIDFQSEFAQVRPLVPADVNVIHIDRGELGTAAAKGQLIESMNRGLGIISYFGHGNIDQWRGDLLTSADAGALENGETLPVVLAITCLNGYFQDPVLDSLAEALLKAERGGAVAVWASSGMCDSAPQAILDQEMFRAIYGRDGSSGRAQTLGEAVMRAKDSINDSDVRLTYILFGDPTTRLK